jgi:hypothetical protein
MKLGEVIDTKAAENFEKERYNIKFREVFFELLKRNEIKFPTKRFWIKDYGCPKHPLKEFQSVSGKFGLFEPRESVITTCEFGNKHMLTAEIYPTLKK